MSSLARIGVLLALCFPFAILADEPGKWSGYVAGEFRWFPNDPLDSRQQENNFSFVSEPEYVRAWNRGRDVFSFTPFLRIDQNDEERTHFDIRELSWSTARRNWELNVGVSKVFWGVIESVHLVDIINQTDLVENPDGEDKLGQPMVNLVLIRQWGTVDLFLLPVFRERTFPGVEGRLRFIPRVDSNQTVYESSAEETHLDWAARWAHSLGDWDVGLSHFSGTSREPRFRLGVDGIESVLIPVYDLINQTGLDVQATKGSWLWKLEAFYRSGQGPSFYAGAGGFEYTFYGIFETRADLGVLLEYLYDNRGVDAATPFQDDVFVGFRLTPNDVQSTELLTGVIFDIDNQGWFYNLEGSRRFGENWILSLEMRLFNNIAANDLLFTRRNDDYLQVELAYHF